MDAAKAFLSISIHMNRGLLQNKKKTQINNPTLHLNKLEKEDDGPKLVKGRKY